MTRQPTRILIRTDATPKSGLGHLSRCIALAAGFRTRGWKVHFCIDSGGSSLPSLLKRGRSNATTLSLRNSRLAGGREDLRQVLRTGKRHGAKAILVDSYAISSSYLQQLTRNGYFVIYLDDFARQSPAANVIVNANIGAETLRFRYSRDAVVLAGNRFALIRREILGLRRKFSRRPIRARVSRVLVSLGGSDPLNLSSRVLRWLDAAPEEFSVEVVVTRLFRRVDQLHQVADSLARQVRIHCEPKNIGQLMRYSDLAITSAGVTSYELACLGVPFLVMKLYENQRLAHHYLVRNGLALNGGKRGRLSSGYFSRQVQRLCWNPELRQQIAREAFLAFDGRGPERVATAVERAFQVWDCQG